MNETQWASRAAFAAAILFAMRFVFFFLPPSTASEVADGTLPGALLAVAEHLLLFPLIAALPAPAWARAAGWGWLVIDMTTDIRALNGVPAATFLAMRYGGHIAAALWFTVAGWPARGAIRWIGLLYALDLAGYSFLAAYGVSFVVLVPSAVLLPLWLVLVGQHLAHYPTGHVRSLA
jgi:hypothetical protein